LPLLSFPIAVLTVVLWSAHLVIFWTTGP